MRYQLLRDFYLVWVDQIWESTTTQSGIITRNTAAIYTNEEVEERGEWKRRYGIVQEIPVTFSDYGQELIDTGLPAPRRFVSHDWIEQMRISGNRGYRDHENPKDKYYPSTFENYDTVKFCDIAKRVNISKGDKVYFLHTSTDMERYMGPFNGGHLFAVRVDEIICSVKEAAVFEGYSKYKKKKITPQGGWVLVELNIESWEDITSPGGIIMKVAPEALPLQGKVIHSANGLDGKNVLFEQDSDAPIVVEGRDLTCMRENEILAVLK